MALTQSERYVTDLLQERFGVTLEKIPESSEDSPDFTCCWRAVLIFTVELKDIEYFPASPVGGWRMPEPGDTMGWASREDNAVSRVASKIHEAFKQLSKYPCPHALIFLNHDPLVDVKDLEEAFTGEHLYGNEDFAYVNTVSKKIAEGRITREKDKIDLYIWIERREDQIWFRYPTQVGHDLAHKYFPPIAEQVPGHVR